MNSQQFNHSQ